MLSTLFPILKLGETPFITLDDWALHKLGDWVTKAVIRDKDLILYVNGFNACNANQLYRTFEEWRAEIEEEYDEDYTNTRMIIRAKQPN